MTPSPASFVVDDASGRDILRGGEAYLRVQTMVPIFVHRYPPAAPAPENPPADQLRVAAARSPRLGTGRCRAPALQDTSVAAVAMTFLHTDVDHFPVTIGEAARVLSPGGGLVYLGVHPAYVGAFLDRTAEIDTQEVRVTAGYGDERLQRDRAAGSRSVAGSAPATSP